MFKKTFRNIFVTTLLASIAIFLPQNMAAQQDLRFGIQLSPISFSWLSSDQNAVLSNGTLWETKLGILGEKRFSDNYSIAFGINWNFNSGGKLQFQDSAKIWTKTTYQGANTFNAAQAKVKMNLRYLEIPIGLHLRTQEFGRMRYYGEPSIFFGFRTKSSGQLTSTTLGTVDLESITNEIGGFNFAWGIGGGVEYSISNNTAFVVGLHYQAGIVDITNDESTSIKTIGGTSKFDNSSITLRGFTVRTAILF